MRLVPFARRLVLGASLAVCGCGEGLVSGDAYANALFTFGGAIAPAGQLAGAHRPLVGVLWTDPSQIAPDVPSDSRYLASEVDATSDNYTAAVFRPPPAAAFVDLVAASGNTARLALGEIVIFDDADDDGTFSVSGPRAEIGGPDTFLAGTWPLIRYVARPFDAPEPDFPFGTATTAGYAILSVRCSGPVVDPVNPYDESTSGAHVDMIAVTSRALPEVRTCARSHSP